jgi:catechol 2,3-dioxygenase-like lactoylglutathione lyase family enzyme
MKTLGIRHLALNVANPQISKQFYLNVMKMTLEWEPDPDNVYLTSGGHDNLALHRATFSVGASKTVQHDASFTQRLDHLGIAVPTLEDVDLWHAWICSQNVPVLREIKSHRDGARSFYIADPDGNVIQIIYHPPIANHG